MYNDSHLYGKGGVVLKILFVFIAGVIAGFVNVNAGAGSLLTLPALILFGLPPAVANGTNRIAILTGAISATSNFKAKGVFDISLAYWIVPPALIGAVIGSIVVISLPDRVFNLILSMVMMLVLVVILINPQKRFAKKHEDLSNKHKMAAALSFLFIGFYGGFIQAGVGILIIATLSLTTGLPLVKINSLKMFVVGIYTIFALIVFILNGKVHWLIGLVLAAGNALGSYIGSNLGIKHGDRFTRIILIVSVIAMALKIAGVF